ncbi:MAG TPA: polysaccharide biosynthesis/export family protein [Syntrophorhabdaceae bacterium]|nr:polysaccharide biosynthesis/export family protein [Syntrophorhabdaceae bacterium]
MKEEIKRFVFLMILISSIFSFFLYYGCASTTTNTVLRKHDGELVQAKDIADLPEGEKTKLRQNLVKEIKEGLTKYRLSPGDMLEVMYHISWVSEAQDYRLGINDEINVDFYYHPQLNRTVVVRPDGRITLPIKGDFMAAGLKPAELAEVIKKTFSDILNDPVVTVSVSKYSSKIFELQKAITNAPRGQAKLVTVGPDGNVYLPMLRGLKASGKTIDELRDIINNEYRHEFNNLSVSILIERIVGNRIFVFGEVQRPGAIPVDKPMTVVQAIAATGGILPTGSMEFVKLMFWNDKNEPVLKTINLKNIMNELKFEEDMIIPNNSVIFVPKTTIAKMNQWVDQYIKQLFLWQGENLGFSYGLGGRSYSTATID